MPHNETHAATPKIQQPIIRNPLSKTMTNINWTQKAKTDPQFVIAAGQFLGPAIKLYEQQKQDVALRREFPTVAQQKADIFAGLPTDRREEIAFGPAFETQLTRRGQLEDLETTALRKRLGIKEEFAVSAEERALETRRQLDPRLAHITDITTRLSTSPLSVTEEERNLALQAQGYGTPVQRAVNKLVNDLQKDAEGDPRKMKGLGNRISNLLASFDPKIGAVEEARQQNILARTAESKRDFDRRVQLFELDKQFRLNVMKQQMHASRAELSSKQVMQQLDIQTTMEGNLIEQVDLDFRELLKQEEALGLEGGIPIVRRVIGGTTPIQRVIPKLAVKLKARYPFMVNIYTNSFRAKYMGKLSLEELQDPAKVSAANRRAVSDAQDQATFLINFNLRNYAANWDSLDLFKKHEFKPEKFEGAE